MPELDITEPVVSALSARTTAAAASWAANGGVPDVSIGGLPFRLAPTDSNPYQRQTADFRRQQIDTSREPGEQSLSQWWVRDQTSWHRGAGVNFYEPGSDETTQYRFARSIGVDVWTKGELKLLRRMGGAVVATSGQSVGCAGAVRSGVNGAYFTVGGGVGWEFGSPSGPTFFSAGTGGPADTDPVIAGSKVIYGNTGGISGMTIGSETGAPIWTFTSGAVVRPWWVKSRIVAARGAELYDLALSGGSFPTPLYTHPASDWTWTGVTETPDAILAAGYSNGYGAIYSFTLSTSGSAGSVPTLGPATVVAEFPPGEEVRSIKGYLGSFLAIGTSRGVRIAVVGDNGRIQYGPLTIETTHPVRALAARDSFVYAGIQGDLDGVSGCARINLAEEITGSSSASSLQFAWAYDVGLFGMIDPGNPVDSISFYGITGEVVLGVRESGLWVMDPDTHVNTGYLLSGKIRYGTAEPKQFALGRVRCTVPGNSAVTLSTVDSSGSEGSVITMAGAFNTDEDIALSTVSGGTQSHIAIKLTLEASSGTPPTGATESPTVDLIQTKALPKPKIHREILYPLILADFEDDRRGTRSGYEGSARDRLQILEELENDNVVVSVTDFTANETFSAIIKRVALERNTPATKSLMNFGGRLSVLVLRL